MIVGPNPRIRQHFGKAWNVLFALFVWDVAVTVFYYLSPFPAPALPLTIFGTVLALVLGFRGNSAYQRWWEGRILWGAMTNVSRSLAREALSFLPRAEAQGLRETLVLRQIAYVHAVRCQLRRQDPAPDVQTVLGPEEEPALARRNPANGLLDGSAMLVTQALERGWIDTIQQTRLEGLFFDMANTQGGMERLKNTPLPAQFRTFPSFFTRLFCILLPVGLVETLGMATPVGSTIAGFMCLAILRIGDELADPFSMTEHGLPLSAITTTIEADLRQAIGQPAPPPVEPKDGVLW